jgi:hypothetical protein
MTILGMPESMFIVFVATILAGSLGAIHYTIVHVLLEKPFGDESDEAVSGQGSPETLTERGEADD